MNHEVKKAPDTTQGRGRRTWTKDRARAGGAETILPQRSQLRRQRGQNGNGEIVSTPRAARSRGFPSPFGHERPTAEEKRGYRTKNTWAQKFQKCPRKLSRDAQERNIKDKQSICIIRDYKGRGAAAAPPLGEGGETNLKSEAVWRQDLEKKSEMRINQPLR